MGNAQNINFTDSLLKGALINSPEVGYGTSFIDLNGVASENVDTNSDDKLVFQKRKILQILIFPICLLLI